MGKRTSAYGLVATERVRAFAADASKELSALGHYGHTFSTVFDDWLAVSALSAERMPDVLSAVLKGEPDPTCDDPAFVRLRESYGSEQGIHFAHAFAPLMLAVEEGYSDVPGEMFMDTASRWRKKGAGQFFTPIDVCYMMSKMTNQSAGTLRDHLWEARADRDAEAVLNSLFQEGADDRIGVIEAGVKLGRVIDAERFEPVKVLDPAVGSGRFLLAAASALPRWAVQLGLVQFYGTDIDRTCWMMCRLNVALHGMNGLGGRTLALMQAQRASAVLSDGGTEAIAHRDALFSALRDVAALVDSTEQVVQDSGDADLVGSVEDEDGVLTEVPLRPAAPSPTPLGDQLSLF